MRKTGLIIALLCVGVVAAAPNIDYLTENDCITCHSVVNHHMGDLTNEDCIACHGSGVDMVDTDSCLNCHIGSLHHEDAAGQCGQCHDDRQYQRGRRQ